MQYFSQSTSAQPSRSISCSLPAQDTETFFLTSTLVLPLCFHGPLSWPQTLLTFPSLGSPPYMLSLHCTVHSCANSSKLESFFQNTYLEKDKVNFSSNHSACLSHNSYTYSIVSLNLCFLFYKEKQYFIIEKSKFRGSRTHEGLESIF